MKTPNSLFDLSNMLREFKLEPHYYDGYILVYNNVEIGFISVRDKWLFSNIEGAIAYSTEDLKKNFSNIVESLKLGKIYNKNKS